VAQINDISLEDYIAVKPKYAVYGARLRGWLLACGAGRRGLRACAAAHAAGLLCAGRPAASWKPWQQP
jgi:hypothetical protein